MGWTPDAGRRKSNGSLVISLKSSFICSSCILCHIMSISMQMKKALSLDLSHCCHICFVSVALSSLTLWFVLGHGFVCVRACEQPQGFWDSAWGSKAAPLPVSVTGLLYALAFLSWVPWKGLWSPVVLVHSAYNWIGLARNRIQD